ncbi:MAG: hypothetical protein KC635_12355, partial [Myxococcales bacterium]|nr:hypothetical protein [Myxococcales bacterium]
MQVVSDKTGYPTEMLELDQDMEADLGIDTVKQAQVFGALRDRFDLSGAPKRPLRDFPTLGHVHAFVVGTLGGGAAAPAATETEAAPEPDLEPEPAPTAVTPAVAGPPMLRLVGSPREMGRAHGQALATEIGRAIEAYRGYGGEQGVARAVGRAEDTARAADLFDEAALDELRGVAEGSGIPFPTLLAYNLDAALFPELMGCSQVGLGPAAHRDDAVHGAILAVNEDSPLILHLGDALTRVTQLRHPDGGHAHVLFGFAGQVGGLNGVNARGLAVTSSVLLDCAADADVRGLVHTRLVGRLLEAAETAEEALALAEATPRTGAWSVTMADPGSTTPVAFEYDGARFVALTGDASRVSANHATTLAAPAEKPAHSRHREARVAAALAAAADAAGAPFGVAAAKALLRDRWDGERAREVRHATMNTVSRVDNVLSLVVDVAAGRLHVAHRGAPDAWQEHDVTALLAPPTAGEPVALDLDALPGGDAAPDTQTRWVQRLEAAPLSPTDARYRPARALVLGAGRVAEALVAKLRDRGADVAR